MKKYLLLFIFIPLLITGCKEKTYTVTFVDNDTILASVNVKKGSNLKNIEVPEKEGYIFVSWLKDGLDYDLNTPINDDTVLSASWTLKPNLEKNHTVTFDIDGVLKTQTVDDGDVAVRPTKDPVKEKYTFLGWYVGEVEYDFKKPVVKDIVIVAKFKKNRIVVTYDLNGGTGSTVTTEIDKGSIPDKPKTPTKFGYNFITWSLDGKPYNFDFPLNADTTIKAIWEATVYVKVTFDSDGGSSIPEVMLSLGTSLSELPTPTKDGYTFKYWTYNGSKFDINTKVQEDIKLVALYELIPSPVPEEEDEKEDSE